MMIAILVSVNVYTSSFWIGLFGEVLFVDKNRDSVEQADALWGIWERAY